MPLTVYNESHIDPIDLEIVKSKLKNKKEDAVIRPGNNCIWVSFSNGVNAYYIFRNNKLVSVQVD